MQLQEVTLGAQTFAILSLQLNFHTVRSDFIEFSRCIHKPERFVFLVILDHSFASADVDSGDDFALSSVK